MINEISNEAIKKLAQNIKTDIRFNSYNSFINENSVYDIDNMHSDHEFAYCIDFNNGTRILCMKIILVINHSKYLCRYLKGKDRYFDDRYHSVMFIKFPYTFINDRYICIPHLNTDHNVTNTVFPFILGKSSRYKLGLNAIGNTIYDTNPSIGMTTKNFLSDGIVIDFLGTNYTDWSSEYVPDYLNLITIGRWK